jgi:hypothetical protein
VRAKGASGVGGKGPGASAAANILPPWREASLLRVLVKRTTRTSAIRTYNTLLDPTITRFNHDNRDLFRRVIEAHTPIDELRPLAAQLEGKIRTCHPDWLPKAEEKGDAERTIDIWGLRIHGVFETILADDGTTVAALRLLRDNQVFPQMAVLSTGTTIEPHGINFKITFPAPESDAMIVDKDGRPVRVTTNTPHFFTTQYEMPGNIRPLLLEGQQNVSKEDALTLGTIPYPGTITLTAKLASPAAILGVQFPQGSGVAVGDYHIEDSTEPIKLLVIQTSGPVALGKTSLPPGTPFYFDLDGLAHDDQEKSVLVKLKRGQQAGGDYYRPETALVFDESNELECVILTQSQRAAGIPFNLPSNSRVEGIRQGDIHVRIRVTPDEGLSFCGRRFPKDAEIIFEKSDIQDRKLTALNWHALHGREHDASIWGLPITTPIRILFRDDMSVRAVKTLGQQTVFPNLLPFEHGTRIEREGGNFIITYRDGTHLRVDRNGTKVPETKEPPPPDPAEVAALRSQLADKDQQISDLRQQLEDQARQLGEAMDPFQAVAEIKRQYTAVQRDLADLDKREASLSTQLDRIQQQMDETSGRLDEVRGQKAEKDRAAQQIEEAAARVYQVPENILRELQDVRAARDQRQKNGGKS